MTVYTSKRWRTWRPKRVAFVDWRAGIGVTDHGVFTLPERAKLADFLPTMTAQDVERVFVTGARIGDSADGLREWMTQEAPGWSPAPEGHYLEDLQQFTLRYCGPDGRRVAIMRAAAWFGEGDYSTIAALAAWNRLGEAVAGAFEGGTLLATPATTGRDLLVRGLGPHRYALAGDEHQALIRSTTGQGRVQLLPPVGQVWDRPAPLGLPGLAEYDGRLMYGALCWGLGSGVAGDTIATGPGAWAALAAQFRENPYRRARYQIRFRVPAGWAHVGLAGVWTGSGWAYPERPGEEGATWVDGSELALMARYGWPFTILRRLTLHDPKPGPLDQWARKLSGLRVGLVAGGERLAGAGARAILLHAIGAFMGRPHVVTRSAPIEMPGAVPPDAVGVRVEGDVIVWGERRAPAWPELSHPEWAAAVWARCRARMLSGPGEVGALHVPRSSVVAFRTDALYLTERQPWSDDGKVGRLRLASWTAGPLPWPESVAQLLHMRDVARSCAGWLDRRRASDG